MTVTPHPRTSLLTAEPPVEVLARDEDARAAWRTWMKLIAVVAAIYLLMYNPYWVPGGDSELYLAVGRSWATGLHHQFNGQFVSISPPGWPIVLAAAMKILPTFGFLKLITIACMTFAIGLWYWFLRRFTTSKQAAGLALLTAIISHVYSLSFWMHSDALFCLLTTAAIVVACQINERRPRLILRIALLAALCVAAQLVRWAGALQWPVIAGVLLSGQPLPLKRGWTGKLSAAPWIALLVSGIFTAGTFLIVRHELKLTPEQETAAKEAGATFDEQQQPQAPAEARPVDIFNGKQSTKTTLAGEMIKRVRESGKWFSWLLWPELRFFGGVKLLSSVDTVLGWMLMIPLFVGGWIGLRRRQWVWLGVAAYCGYLCLNWPAPTPRYLVPVLPLVLFGMMTGITTMFARWPSSQFGVKLLKVLVVSVIVANVSLLSVDVWVARSHDFYGRYEGGLDESLISAVRYLNNRGINNGELAVSDVYTNLGRRRQSKFGLRATVMLSNRIVKNVPNKVPDDVTKAKFINWARSRHIRWYLYQEPISPWRVWHFRLPAWLQKTLSREEVAPESAGWVLYRYVAPVNFVVPFGTTRVMTLMPPKWVKVDVQPVHDWPTRVPGL